MFHKNDVEMRKKNILMITEIVKKRMYFLRTINIALLIIEEKSKISKKSKTASNQQSMGAISILASFSEKNIISKKNANNQKIDQSTEIDSKKSKKFFQTINQKKNV